MAAIRRGIAGFDRQAPALGHRVARVDDEVHDDLLDLSGVDPVSGRVALLRDRHHDVLADDAPQHRLDLLQRDVEVDHLGLQHLLAAEGEHLPRELGGAHRRRA